MLRQTLQQPFSSKLKSDDVDKLEQVKGYHQRTKHSLQEYAAGPDGLDWDDQPEAFRWFDGTPKFQLPLVADKLTATFSQVFRSEETNAHTINKESIAALFELSLGLSAWKQSGDAKWALRCNPSSGNLHPTEGYAVLPQTEDIPAGVYHYLSRDHTLEQRCQVDNFALPDHCFLVGLSSIHWREAWKYGERAYRYCQLDVGHAIACMGYAAACLGWNVSVLDHWSDEEIASLLGLNHATSFTDAEKEHSDVLLLIDSSDTPAADINIETLLSVASEAKWQGKANKLSPLHGYDWPIIDVVSEACTKPGTQRSVTEDINFPPPLSTDSEALAATIIRQRRSAQAFDGTTTMPVDTFYKMMDAVLPRNDTLPWSTLNSIGHLHLIIFVHRIKGLNPGLYLLGRKPGSLDFLKAQMPREEFKWKKPDDCPEHIPLYCLAKANGQRLAGTLSCHQGIAAQSCFSLGMLAEFEDALEEPWHYRQLYWEAGTLGQVLYLEAEAAGVRGTGIGCYFDDDLHGVLGISTAKLQSLYHFTVGVPIVDARLTTLAPYSHLEESQ